MYKPIIISCTILLSTLLTTHVQAEACTYNEAVLAYSNGNLVRGQALMKMAARDGDQRAVQFFVSYKYNKNQSRNTAKALSEVLFVVGSSNSTRTTVKTATVN